MPPLRSFIHSPPLNKRTSPFSTPLTPILFLLFNLCSSPITFRSGYKTRRLVRQKREETGTNLCFKDIQRNQRRSETSTDLIRQIGDTDYRELLAIPSWYSSVSLPVQNCWRKSERIEAFWLRVFFDSVCPTRCN